MYREGRGGEVVGGGRREVELSADQSIGGEAGEPRARNING